MMWIERKHDNTFFCVEYCWYMSNKNQQDAPIYSHFIWQLISACFEQIYCPSSGGTFLYKSTRDDEQ